MKYVKEQQQPSAVKFMLTFLLHHLQLDVIENLHYIGKKAGCPQHLVIEITESMLIERPNESVKRMEQIANWA